jgi:hypothetical protein
MGNFSKYITVIFISAIYLNTSLFVCSVDERNGGRTETGSIAKLLSGLIAGAFNDVDEDGDSSDSHCSVKTVQQFVSQQTAQAFFGRRPAKIFFPADETVSQQHVYGQIDHPPQS